MGAQYLTHQDVQDYGTDLIGVTQRAALEVVAPHLQNLAEDNAQLRQRLAVEARRNLDQRVEKYVPDYRSIDEDPRWHQWLRTTDTLSGRIRQVLLDDAISAGDAARIANFFRQFQRSEDGSRAGAPSQTYGRASSSGKPTYTRPMINQLYAAKRRGAYVGRESEWARIEQDIIAATRENRIDAPAWVGK